MLCGESSGRSDVVGYAILDVSGNRSGYKERERRMGMKTWRETELEQGEKVREKELQLGLRDTEKDTCPFFYGRVGC